MHRGFIWSLGALAALLAPSVSAQSKYVGIQVCTECHDTGERGGAMATWRASSHAKAFATLGECTENEPRECGDVRLWIVRMSRGERYGLPTRATEAKECLPCHSTAFGAGPERLAATFDRAAGVQCESCHGPGSAHAEAMRTGSGAPGAATLTVYADEGAIRKRCASCHDGTCGTLDFATMWPRIEHKTVRRR